MCGFVMGSGSSKQKNGTSNSKTYIIKELNDHSGGINCMVLTPDGTKLVTGSEDTTIRIFDLQAEEAIVVLKGHEKYINSVCCNEKYIYTASADRTIRKWNIVTGMCVKTFRGHTDSVNRLVLVGNALFSSSYDSTIRAWDIDSGEILRVFQGHKRLVNSLLYVPSDIAKDSEYNYAELDQNDDVLVSGSADCTAKLWAMNSSECILTYRGHNQPVLCLAVDSSGTYVYTGSQDATVRSWEVMTGKCIRTFSGHQASIIQIEVSFPNIVKVPKLGFSIVMITQLYFSRCCRNQMLYFLFPNFSKYFTRIQEIWREQSR